MTDLAQRNILHALFCLSRDTRHISAATLAAAAGMTPTRAGEALLALERAGLVDATRARLTMRGLVAAMRSGAASGGGGVERLTPRQAPSGSVVQRVPWAAESERPEAYVPSAPAPAP